MWFSNSARACLVVHVEILNVPVDFLNHLVPVVLGLELAILAVNSGPAQRLEVLEHLPAARNNLNSHGAHSKK